MEKQLVLPKRIRNELCFRTIRVSSKQVIAQNFWRVSFEHPDLAGFHSAGFDDHIKVFFPTNQVKNLVKPSVTDEGIVWPEAQQPLNRDYTPLAFDGQSRLVLDFFRHHGGAASGWAETAEEGQMLVMGGPRGSLVVPTSYATQIYICDETGLPALSRRLGQIAKQNIALFIFAKPQVVAEYLPDLNAQIAVTIIPPIVQLQRDFTALFAQLAMIQIPENDTFCWITGEGKAVKILSDYFILQRQCRPELVRVVAYWHQHG